MRTVSAKLAALAMTAAVFSLPAGAQTMDHAGTATPGATAPSAGTPAGVGSMSQSSTTVTPGDKDEAGQSAKSQDVMKKQDQSAQSQDKAAMRNSTAMTPDVGAVGDKRASRLIGKDVVNDKDQTIGKVDDILIGPGDKATTAVISVGGFLGIDAKLVTVPFDQLTPAANDRKALTMPNATKESLKAMPAFNYGNGA
jgi:sporulation protein YlmC with PRC-barrel domain